MAAIEAPQAGACHPRQRCPCLAGAQLGSSPLPPPMPMLCRRASAALVTPEARTRAAAVDGALAAGGGGGSKATGRPGLSSGAHRAGT
eukprot:362607-Chlamydomonas_euryale.AAC.7